MLEQGIKVSERKSNAVLHPGEVFVAPVRPFLSEPKPVGDPKRGSVQSGDIFTQFTTID